MNRTTMIFGVILWAGILGGIYVCSLVVAP
jgi:hypothetical protein